MDERADPPRAPAEPTADYWSRVAGRKSFAHPLDLERFGGLVPPTARVLDVGCGWGRIVAELRDAGWAHVVGVDPAHGMIAHGRSVRPDLELVHSRGGALPFPDASFDAALLFAVLTAVPADADQRALVGEVRRILRPGGILYVSDLLLNDDERNLARYAEGAPRFGRHGVFELPEGVVLRHHDPVWLAELFSAFEPIERVPFTATTMNGHRSRAFQEFLRR